MKCGIRWFWMTTPAIVTSEMWTRFVPVRTVDRKRSKFVMNHLTITAFLSFLSTFSSIARRLTDVMAVSVPEKKPTRASRMISKTMYANRIGDIMAALLALSCSSAGGAG